MRSTFFRVGRLLTMILAGTIAAPFSSAPAVAHDAESSAAARVVWSAIDAAFNARDAERFSRLFTADASFVRIKRKQALDGRAAIFEEFARRFPGFSPDVRHLTSIHQVFAVAPGVLAADGTVEILRAKPDESAPSAILQTYAIFTIMNQEIDGWKVRTLRVYEMPTGEPTHANER